MLTYPISALAQGSKTRQTAKMHKHNFYESSLKEIIGIQICTHQLQYLTTARIIAISLMKDRIFQMDFSGGCMGPQL